MTHPGILAQRDRTRREAEVSLQELEELSKAEVVFTRRGVECARVSLIRVLYALDEQTRDGVKRRDPVRLRARLELDPAPEPVREPLSEASPPSDSPRSSPTSQEPARDLLARPPVL